MQSPALVTYIFNRSESKWFQEPRGEKYLDFYEINPDLDWTDSDEEDLMLELVRAGGAVLNFRRWIDEVEEESKWYMHGRV